MGRERRRGVKFRGSRGRGFRARREAKSKGKGEKRVETRFALLLRLPLLSSHLLGLEEVLVDCPVLAQHLRGRQEAPEGDRARDPRVVARVGGLGLFFSFFDDVVSLSIAGRFQKSLALFNSLSSSSRRALFYLDFYLESDAFGLEGLQDRTGRHFEGKSGKEKGREKCDADWFAETTRNFERALSSRERSLHHSFLGLALTSSVLLHSTVAVFFSAVYRGRQAVLFSYIPREERRDQSPGATRGGERDLNKSKGEGTMMRTNASAFPSSPPFSSAAAAAHPKTRLELEELVDSLFLEVRP